MDLSKTGKRLYGLTALCVALWGLVVISAYFWGANTVLDRMEWRTVDWRFQLRGPLAPSGKIAIVAVDEESIRTEGRWPWPRERFAKLTEELTRLGAKRIIFDVFFSEADNGPGGRASDATLVAATRRAGIVYHSGFIYQPGTGKAGALPEAVTARAWQQTAVVRAGGVASVAGLIEPAGLTFPLPELTTAARGIGIANVLDSGDGVYRHLVPVVRYQGALYPSVALAIGADLCGVAPSQIRVIPGRYIEMGERRLPLDMSGRLLINFVGPGSGRAYPYTSVASVLDRAVKPNAFAGKVVMVGVTAPGIYDLRASPYETNFYGVESEANAIDSILENRFLCELPTLYTGGLLLLLILIFGALLPRLPTAALCGLSVAGIVGYPWAASWLFSDHGLVVSVVHPTLLMLGSFVILLVVRLVVEERRRQVAHTILKHFVPPQLVGRLVEEEALTTMRGERREITVFFADLRNFTASAEELAPEDTVIFLNRYFSLMHEVIWEHEGTLDKYIGDEIMVFHNAPLAQADHARRSIMTAIDMQRRIMANQAEWEFLQIPGLHAGIGIATGQAVVGYVGSGERMQYTVIGRTVNLASRLQTLCKQLRCRILINDATYQAVSDLIEVEDLGDIPIPGFQLPVRVWHVLDYKDAIMRGNWAPVDAPIRRRPREGLE